MTAWSIAHSTCRGLGCIAWLAGSLRGTEQYRSAKSAGSSGSPAVTAAGPPPPTCRRAWAGAEPAATGASVGTSSNVTGLPVISAVARMVTGRGAAGLASGTRGSVGPAGVTEVTASSPWVDTRLPAGTSSSATLPTPATGSDRPAPVTYT